MKYITLLPMGRAMTNNKKTVKLPVPAGKSCRYKDTGRPS